MIVPACTRTEGELFYHALAEGRDYAPTLYEIGGGSRAEGEAIVKGFQSLVADLLAKCEEMPTQTDQLKFDALAAERVHSVMPLPDEISGDDAFWRYLALAETWPLAQWRHGRADDEPPALNHLG